MSTPANFDLTGRVALVTGGNGGIGRGIALGFAEAGAAVAIFGRNKEKNARVLAELKATRAPAMAVSVDVTDRAALEPAFRQVEAQLGPVDILVNNAGIVSLSGGVMQESPARQSSWLRLPRTLSPARRFAWMAATLSARNACGQHPAPDTRKDGARPESHRLESANAVVCRAVRNDLTATEPGGGPT